MDKPNIIFMITHDTGTYFSGYGGPVPTPNVDWIAEKGVKFTNNYATAPQCTPSRGSMVTGKMPHANGLMGLTNLGWNLPESNLTLPKMLKKVGYSTHLIGLQHEHRYPHTTGYDTVSNRRDAPYFARSVKKRACKFFEDVEAGKIQQPFYCSIGFFETHRPYISGMTMRSKPEDIQIPYYMPDTPGVRKELCNFEGSLREFNKRMGQILDKFRECSFVDNTLLIYTVDHGIPFPRAKGTLFDPGLHTALMMYMPGKIEGGKTFNQMISNVDLFPTIIDIIGEKLPEDAKKSMQGRSFFNLLIDKSYKERERVFFELTYHDQGYNPMRGIRTKKWKFIKNFRPLDRLYQIPLDFINKDSGKDTAAADPNYNTPRSEEELYDLESDPEERINLIEKEEYGDTINKLRNELMEFLENSNDPILKDEVPEPKKPGFMIF